MNCILLKLQGKQRVANPNLASGSALKTISITTGAAGCGPKAKLFHGPLYQLRAEELIYRNAVLPKSVDVLLGPPGAKREQQQLLEVLFPYALFLGGIMFSPHLACPIAATG